MFTNLSENFTREDSVNSEFHISKTHYKRCNLKNKLKVGHYFAKSRTDFLEKELRATDNELVGRLGLKKQDYKSGKSNRECCVCMKLVLSKK